MDKPSTSRINKDLEYRMRRARGLIGTSSESLNDESSLNKKSLENLEPKKVPINVEETESEEESDSQQK